MRVTAQLIDAETGSHLWGRRYDQPRSPTSSMSRTTTTSSIVCAIQARGSRSPTQRPPCANPPMVSAHRTPAWAVASLKDRQHGEPDGPRGLSIVRSRRSRPSAPPYHALAQTDNFRHRCTAVFHADVCRGGRSGRTVGQQGAHTRPERCRRVFRHGSRSAAARGDLGTELAMAEQAISRNPNCATAYRIKGGCEISYPASRAQGCQAHLRALLCLQRTRPGQSLEWRG